MDLFRKKPYSYTRKVRFNVKSLEVGHHNTTYRSVPVIKCPFDYIIYQMIIFDLKPDLIVEIGAGQGGSSLYMADLLDINKNGVIHSIDIQDQRYDETKNHERIKFFLGGYQNYDLENLKSFQRILIIDDGSHMYQDVKATLEKFNSYITKDSYFIVEDGILDELGWTTQYKGGPNRAIKEFLSSNDSFVIDRKWCDLFGVNATFNTNGFLKKVNNNTR
jgi:cephalosporin hydroxylase